MTASKDFPFSFAAKSARVLTVSLNMFDLLPPFGLGGSSGEDGDLVPAFKQSLHDNPTHVSCATDDKNVHINKFFLYGERCVKSLCLEI